MERVGRGGGGAVRVFVMRNEIGVARKTAADSGELSMRLRLILEKVRCWKGNYVWNTLWELQIP